MAAVTAVVVAMAVAVMAVAVAVVVVPICNRPEGSGRCLWVGSLACAVVGAVRVVCDVRQAARLELARAGFSAPEVSAASVMHRRVNVFLYLNGAWDESRWGGHLRLCGASLASCGDDYGGGSSGVCYSVGGGGGWCDDGGVRDQDRSSPEGASSHKTSEPGNLEPQAAVASAITAVTDGAAGAVAVASIAPLRNRLIVFETTGQGGPAVSPHYHGHPSPLRCPAGRSRRSIAAYYYSAEAA